MKKIMMMGASLLLGGVALAQNAGITINADRSLGDVSPYLFGQFIEYMGACINGGIIDEGNPLSDEKGIRLDVLEKIEDLAPTMMRFPGGTSIKTFHWEDGVGPLSERKTKKNLVWGGLDNYHFGTCEFIDYCRKVGCEPVLVINMSTGTPDEAANWVEYCNGTEDTYYANLRRKHGYPEPFNVKYWALGNEEAADADAGRHQDPHFYVKDGWHFIKLMKLTDPTIEIIADGERGIPEWNKVVLEGLDGAIDYISYHGYVSTGGNPYSIYGGINRVGEELSEMSEAIKKYAPGDTSREWKKWYRFPARTKPIKIAMDEWGIWEYQEPPYGTTNTYEWRHALATAYYLNTILRHADDLGMCNWAQTVNILAPIRTNKDASVCQTVFYPLREYRKNALSESVEAVADSKKVRDNLQSLNVAATINRADNEVTLFVVNISPDPVTADLTLNGLKPSTKIKDAMTMTASSIDAKNVLSAPDKNVVNIDKKSVNKKADKYTFPAESVTILTLK